MTAGTMVGTTKIIARELAAALAVIATFALVLVYQPTGPALARAEQSVKVIASLCGAAPVGSDHGQQGPCHACRQNAVTLPPPAGDVVPAYAAFIAFVFTLESEALPDRAPTPAYRSRAPPPFSV